MLTRKSQTVIAIFFLFRTSKRYAFLFDKFLLLCKIQRDTYEIKEKLNLKRFKVDAETSDSGRGKVSLM